ncbi:MAG: V-type ATP synthase subunit E [Candidatus Heimdallarchaeaceae archaeon]
MSIENESLEIIAKIEENTEKRIKEILAEKEAVIREIQAETEEKIKNIRDKIILEAQNKAKSEIAKEKAIHELDLKLKVTKTRAELIDNFIEKAKAAIKEKVKTKDYENSLKIMISESALILNESPLIIKCRKEDKKILTKQFLNGITEALKKENNVTIEFTLDDTFINTLGGVLVETPDGSIRVDNTYEKRIERSLEEIKRKIGRMLIAKE